MNPTENNASFEQRLQALRQTYVEGLPGRMQAILDAWKAVVGQSSGHMQELHRLVHTMAGSSATFGHQAVGTAARTIEIKLKDLCSQDQSLGEAGIAEIEQRLDALKETIAQAVSSDTSVDLGMKQGLKETPQTEPQEKAVGTLQAVDSTDAEAAGTRSVVRVYLLEDDPEIADVLSLQLEQFGYNISRYAQAEEFRQAVRRRPPDAVIVDIKLSPGEDEGTHALKGLQLELDRPVPAIFISARNDFDARLDAVRAGGEAFFSKPFEISALLEMLDRLTHAQEGEPYRALIVDDSASEAKYYAQVLGEAGIRSRQVHVSSAALTVIDVFNPDIILMDMYMPDCNGLELARIIRQHDAYLSIPIVYLSSETDIDLQLKALSQGGDDFLTKPIRPAHLISSVRSRVERARILRSLMVRDSLTGLYNHSTIKEQLDKELFRAQRIQSCLSFAMVDIDRFKGVNDTFGHVMGDRVIKGLSRLLQQRLRRTDIVGRYGGEEFAVVLPDIGPETAVQVMNGLRESFNKIVFHADAGDFSISFSCGIATYPGIDTPGNLTRAADHALYRAKNGGRNRVCLAVAEDDRSGP